MSLLTNVSSFFKRLWDAYRKNKMRGNFTFFFIWWLSYVKRLATTFYGKIHSLEQDGILWKRNRIITFAESNICIPLIEQRMLKRFMTLHLFSVCETFALIF